MFREVEVEKTTAMAIIVMLLISTFTLSFIAILLTVKGDPPFSNNIKVNTDASFETQSSASITIDPYGNVSIVWEDFRNGDWDIYFASSSDQGATWTHPNVKINTDIGTEDQTNPTINNDSLGALYVAWQDYRNGDWDIYFANSTDGGSTWTDPNVRINKDAGTQNQGNPDLAVDSSGTIYAVWDDRRNGDWDIYFAKSADGGATWTDPNVKINTDVGTESQRYPIIEVDSSGNIYVAWEDYRNFNSDIYFANSTDGGLTWTNPNVRVNTDAGSAWQESPSIAVNSSGTIYLAWHDYRNVNSDIYFAKSEDGGATWTDPNVKINSDPGSDEQYFSAIDEVAGTIYVAWEDYRNVDSDIYFAQSINGGINWTDPNLRVNDDTGSYVQWNPAITVAPNGSAYLAWEDDRDGDFDIYFANLIPPPPPPTIDRIIVSRTSDANSGWAGDKSYFLSGSDTFYACGWNDTYNEFVGPVEADWFCNDTLVGLVAPGPGPSTSFAPLGSGICTVTATNLTYGSNTTGILTVVSLDIDRIIISRSSDCSDGWIGDKTYTKNDNDIYYACGWNNTSSVFVMQVEATWASDNMSVGDVTLSGTSTTFNAVGVGECKVTATNATYGFNETGILTVNPLVIDDILISRSSDGTGGWIGDRPYKKYDTDTFYSCGWNKTHDEFVILVNATWVSDNDSIGAVNFGPNFSTTFNAQGVGTCNVTATNATYGFNKTGVLTINPLDIDRIIISNSSDYSSGWITDQTYTKHDTDTFYACGWNNSRGEFVDLVDVDWISDNTSVGKVTIPGTSTAFNASGMGQCSVTAFHASYGSNVTGILTVNPLEIDRILISLSDNGTSDWIGDRYFNLFDEEIFYACGWNDTHNEFVNLVEAVWVSNDTNVGNVSSPGTSTTFSADGIGVCNITATNSTYGFNYTGILTVVPLEIDRIFISRAPDGSSDWIGDRYYVLGDSDTFYLCGWNRTYDLLVSLVDADWASDDNGVGTVDPGLGSQTTFNVVGIGTCNVSATNTTYGLNWTGILTVSDYGIDRIIISNTSDASSGWIGDQTYIKHDTDIYYSCGWNDTYNLFVKLVETSWLSDDPDIGDVVASGASTTFSALDVGTCTVRATNATHGSNDTGILNVNPLEIVRIMISLSSNGSSGWIGDHSYVGGASDIFYACGWNDSYDEFVSLVEVDWSSTNEAVGTVTTTGHWTNFTAQPILNDGTCKIMATDPISSLTNVTGALDVLAPNIDYIQIRDEAGGLGNIVTTRTYSILEVDEFYAAAYNHTVDYLYDVAVAWECDDVTVGKVTTPGVKTNFTAENVTSDGTCKVTGTYQGFISNSTGILKVLSPGVDYIQIRDAPGGGGIIVTTATYNAGETDEFYAAAYNYTVKYLYDVDVAWASDDPSVGEVTSPGSWTNFTAQNVISNDTCTVTATYSTTISNSTGFLTVLSVMDTTPPSAPGQPTLEVKGKDKIKISWPANTESDLESYIIQRSKDPDGPWTNITVNKDTTSYTDTGLDPDTTYYYRIIAVDNSTNPSSPSPMVKATTEPEEGFPWILLIALLIVIIIVVLLLLMLSRKKPKDMEEPPMEEKEPTIEPSEEEIPVEEELPPEGEALSEEEPSIPQDETTLPEILEEEIP